MTVELRRYHSLFTLSLLCCACSEHVYTNQQAAVVQQTEDNIMPVQQFSYKGQQVEISADADHPKMTINGKKIPVVMNDKDSFTPVRHLPYSSFSSLEEAAKKVIDENLAPLNMEN